VLLPTDTAVNFCTSSITLALADLPANAVVRWSSGATTTSIPVDASGTHSVSVSAPDHCPCSASIRVVDLCATSVHAPNAFTPNADGINDVWRPVWTTNADAILEFTVFDRWGGLLFSSTDLGDGWDGTVNGTPLPSGLYPWIGMAKDPVTSRVSELRGKIALIR
jgi:gliding motility-associated-like protein